MSMKMKKVSLPYVMAGLMAVLPTAGYSEVNFAQKPLFAGGEVEPNVMFILDDSGSMRWGFMPDDLVNPGVTGGGNTLPNCQRRPVYDGRRYCAIDIAGHTELASPSFNTIYYDPDRTYAPPLRADGTRYPNVEFTNAPVDGYDPGGTVNLETDYRAIMDDFYYWGYHPGQEQWISGFTVSDGGTRERAFVYVPGNGCGSTVTEDCLEKRTIPSTRLPGTSAEQEQNFANWFSYYRTRIMLAKAGIGEAFGQDFDREFRLGWGEINQGEHWVDGAEVRAVMEGVRRYSDVKSDFYSWVYGQSPSGGTPLQKALEGAGKYYEKSLRAWSDYPERAVDATNPTWECRQSNTILMTDGYYNTGGSNDPDLTEHADDTDGPVITDGANAPYQYKPSAPFSDGVTSRVTLADIAMHYWKRDLQPSIGNYVPTQDNVVPTTEEAGNGKKPELGNPAFWQHMVTYGVGLGVTGTVDPEDAVAAALAGDTVNWWGGNSNEDKINDLLHATINGRGKFFSAANTEQFQDALTEILADLNARAGSSTGLDFNITSFKEGALLFSAAFDPARWAGDVKAVELLRDAEGEPQVPGEGDPANGWSAREKLDARDLTTNDRTIITYDGDRGRPFRWSDLTSDQKADLAFGDASLAEDRLAYLRGDRSFESNLLQFRKRGSRLGSIVNSTPRFVAAPDSEWPNTSAFGDGKYSLFRTAMKDRTPVVYAGANDGMLHGFKGTNDDQGGEELLAYIPSFVYSDKPGLGLHFLTEPDYQHRYYVDLETRVTDVYTRGRNSAGGISGESWRTVLIGGGRAGAKGIFALDITDPDSFSEDNAQGTVLWEFTHEKLGYLVQPPVVSLADWGNGDYRWTAFVSSGFNSGSTGFFMLDMEGGLDGNWSAGDYRYIEFENGDGLGPLTVIDNTSDYIANRVYAGDLDGNLWVAAESSNGWASAYKQGASPIPYVSVGKPITSAPTVGPSAFSGKDPNLMILFGTGKYLETSDSSSTQVQSFYGVLEEGDTRNTLTESDLVLRNLQVGSGQVDGVTQLIRFAEGDKVDYESKHGWYVNLPVQGERIVTNGVIRGNYVYVSTLIPSSNPCLGGGDGWIMAFDIQEGLVGINDNVGAFEDSTYNAMGYKVDGVPSQLKIWDEYLAYDCAGCGARLDSLPPFGLALGRKGWRELTQ